MPHIASRVGRWAAFAALGGLAACAALAGVAAPTARALAATRSAAPKPPAFPAALAPRLAFAQALSDSGRYTSADSVAQMLLATPALSPADSATVLDLLLFARSRNSRSTLPGTHALAERAVAIRQAAASGDSLPLARALDNLANVFTEESQAQHARDVFVRALGIRARHLGAEDPLVALGWHNIARADYSLGHFEDSRAEFERAKDVREKVLGSRNPETVRSWMGLATVDYMRTRLDLARPECEHVLAVREAVLPAAHPDLLQTRNMMALILGAMGDAIASRDLAQHAVDVTARALGPDHAQVGDALVTLAFARERAGDKVGSVEAYERAAAVFEKAYGPDHYRTAQVMGDWASELCDLGDTVRAEPLFMRALDASRRLTSTPIDLETSLTFQLGRLRAREQRFAEAESLTRVALGRDTLKLAADNANIGRDWVNIGAYRCQSGHCAEATPFFDHAIATYLRRSQPDSVRLGIAVDGLGSSYMARGDTARARSEFLRALMLDERRLGVGHPQASSALSHLSMLAQLARQPDDALAWALRSEDVGRSMLASAAGALSERQALSFEGARVGGCDEVIGAITCGPATPRARRAAWDALIRSRALVLDATAARVHDAHAGDSTAVRLVGEVADARDNLSAAVVRGPAGSSVAAYTRLLEGLHTRVDEAERALAEHSPAFERRQGRDTLGFDDVARALAVGQALVGYARYHPVSAITERGPARYAALVLRGGSKEPTLVPLGAAADLEPLLERWGRALGQRPPADADGARAAERDVRALGAQVRRAVWDPLLGAIGDASWVGIVPDGALHLVPFAALPTTNGRYLVETGPTLHTLTSERDVVPAPDPAPTGTGLLALGGPAFDAEAGANAPVVASAGPLFRGARARCADFAKVRFAALPGAEAEARDVCDAWTAAEGAGSAPLTGAAASEEAFRSLAPGRRILHIATHGFFLEPACARAGESGTRGVGAIEDAAAAGSGGGAANGGAASGSAGASSLGDASVAPASPTNSLVLSGLALAGANHRDEATPCADDGILTAEEIAALDLRGVEWAVLSGCDTGVGPIALGEGVFGLRRSFLEAGARTVIMSLWPIEDAETREWMRALYRHRLVDHASTAQSVRDAARDRLAARRARHVDTHPFHWAAFLATGDWR
ncbi:MAG TPA: CHAT domain-containing protein [Candidatus Saccharimonadaceae bacterium]|nr:CHAT domain-containing protein [Candidatus Saccharimonadaceae bacterium]